MVRLLFVCLGNICRSPSAQGVAEQQVAALGLSDQFEIDSAGTHGYHIGARPDSRAIAAATARGIDLSRQRARQVQPTDFVRFNYMVAMDRDNLANLIDAAGTEHAGRANHSDNWLGQLGELAGQQAVDVPDPYYGGSGSFDQVLDILERSIADLLSVVTSRHKLSQKCDNSA